MKNQEVVNEEQIEVVEKKSFKEKVSNFKETKVGKALGTAGKIGLGALLAIGALAGVDAIKSKKDGEYYDDLDALTSSSESAGNDVQ